MAEFALATSILSTIAFALQLWTDSAEIRKSGSSISTADCTRQAESLKTHCDRVKLLQDSEAELDEAARIRTIATEIHEFGDELSTRLARCALPPGAGGWRRYRDVIAVLWRGMRMDADAQMRRLVALRNELQSELLVSMLRKVSVEDLQRKAAFRRLDDDVKALTLGHLQGLEAVLTKVDSLAVAEEQRHQEIMAELRRWDPLSAHARPAVPPDHDLVWKKDMVTELKNRLWYGSIPRRHDAIATAHEKTFEWIFTGQKKTHQSNTTLMEWMTGGTGPYWVSGRAGTGKSSLMRFLNDDERTREAFQTWAGDRPLGLASFYFWNSEAAGDDRLKSLTGLYRAILFTLIEQHPSLADVFFPDHLVKGRRWDTDFPTFIDMAQGFERFSTASELPVAVGLIIDGLDEYEAPHSKQVEAAAMLRRASESPNIKVIVSSRPEAAFETAFRDSTKLRLHELTEEDRRTYVHDKLTAVPRLHSITTKEQQLELIDLVVERSEGIFLWVNLTVATLVEEIELAMDISRLLRVTSDIPGGNKELGAIFDHMLRNRIPEKHRTLGLQVIQTLKYGYTLPSKLIPWVEGERVRHPITAILCSFFEDDLQTTLEIPVKPLTVAQAASRTEMAINMVRQSCAGLLEFREYESEALIAEQPSVKAMELHYLHKDVSIYLETADTVKIFEDSLSGTHGDIQVNLLKCIVSFIRTISVEDPAIVSWAESWTLNSAFWQLVEYCMRLARDTEERNPEQTESLLDAMDQAVNQHWQPDGFLVPLSLVDSAYWTNHFPVDRHYTGMRVNEVDVQILTFLSFTVQQDLFFYLQSKLRRLGPAVLHVPGRPLLHIACGTDPTWWLLRGRRPARVVKLLLDHGADPHEVFDGQTAWQVALDVTRRSATTSFPERKEIGEVLLALVHAGADIHAVIRWTERRKISKRNWVTDEFSRPATQQIRLTFMDGELKEPGRYCDKSIGGTLSANEEQILKELGRKILATMAEKQASNGIGRGIF
ncbi:Vegetative incompatibility protein HET-E-1 like [Verticillium longisporum]|nr:Vegetative incompatibility protein HET-E-1 like [Verticillium longisporum]